MTRLLPITLLAALVSSAGYAHAQTATDRAAQHLSQAIAFKTISNQNPAKDDQTAFSGLRTWLDSTYPRVKAILTREVMPGGALLYRWQGTDATLRPIMFLAHQDVVPVEPGTETAWSQAAFAGTIAGGYVWGRGALDDKGTLVTLMETAEALIASGFTPKRTIYFGFGSDEEVGGIKGARALADVLVQRSVRLAWVLDEGSSIINDQSDPAKKLIAKIGIGQKGYATILLTATGQGGSSSMPPARSAIQTLAHALVALADQPYTTSRRMVAAFRAASEASQRTTLVPTILQAGVKDNVVPTIAIATLNARLWPGDTIEMLLAHIRAVADHDITITLKSGTNPLPLSTTSSPGFAAVQAAIAKVTPTIPVTAGVISSTADARHMMQLTDAVYYFMPWILHEDDLARIHGVNERLSLTQLEFGMRFFTELMSKQ